jgi:hypothetical protein
LPPTRDEIRREALRLFHERFGPGLNDPEDDELKEVGLWEEARRRLMARPEAHAEEEVGRYVEELVEELERHGYRALREEEYEELRAAKGITVVVKGDYPRYVESPCCELPMRLLPTGEYQCVCCEARYRVRPGTP